MPEKFFYTFLILLGIVYIGLSVLDTKHKYANKLVTFGAVCLWGVIISAIC